MRDYSFGNFLYTLRNEKGLSQKQMGELLGVTNKAVSKWENGSAKPNTKLLPEIAALLGVTVEELFASKRLDKERELLEIKQYLSAKKKKYAILSSAFLSVILILPVLLILFIAMMDYYSIPDDVGGPLGAVGFILVFIISILCAIIYHSNFKEYSFVKGETEEDSLIARLNGATIFSVFFIAVLVILLINLLMIHLLSRLPMAVLLCSIFAWDLLFGALIYLLNLRRLLKIKSPKKKKEPFNFSESSKPVKICYILFLSLASIIFGIYLIRIINLSVPPWLMILQLILIPIDLVFGIVVASQSNKVKKP